MNCFYQYIGNTANKQSRMSSKSCFENGCGKEKLKSKGIHIRGYLCVCGWSYQKNGATDREMTKMTELHARVCKMAKEEREKSCADMKAQLGRLFLEEKTTSFKEADNGQPNKLRQVCTTLNLLQPWQGCDAVRGGMNGVKHAKSHLTIREFH